MYSYVRRTLPVIPPPPSSSNLLHRPIVTSEQERECVLSASRFGFIDNKTCSKYSNRRGASCLDLFDEPISKAARLDPQKKGMRRNVEFLQDEKFQTTCPNGGVGSEGVRAKKPEKTKNR